jgi:hypothetical protein
LETVKTVAVSAALVFVMEEREMERVVKRIHVFYACGEQNAEDLEGVAKGERSSIFCIVFLQRECVGHTAVCLTRTCRRGGEFSHHRTARAENLGKNTDHWHGPPLGMPVGWEREVKVLRKQKWKTVSHDEIQ